MRAVLQVIITCLFNYNILITTNPKMHRIYQAAESPKETIPTLGLCNPNPKRVHAPEPYVPC